MYCNGVIHPAEGEDYMHFQRMLSVAIVTLLSLSAFALAPVVVEESNTETGNETAIGETETGSTEEQETNTDHDPGGRGFLQIFLTDDPLDGLQNVIIEIASIEAHNDMIGWVPVTVETQEVDLLDLRDISEVIALGALPSGNYTQLRLVLSNATCVQDGEVKSMKIPSSDTSGLKLNLAPPVPISPGNLTNILLDFDVNKSAHYSKGQGWILRPVINLIWTSVESIIYLDPSQLARLELLDNTSSSPFEIRWDELLLVPAFISGQWGTDPLLPTPEDKARVFLESNWELFRMDRAKDSFAFVREMPSRLNFTNLKFQQMYGTIPVFGAEEIVNMIRDDVFYVHGTFVPHIDVGTIPRIGQSEAESFVEADLRSYSGAGGTFTVHKSELTVYNPSVVNRYAPNINYLSWYVRARLSGYPGDWTYFVNALTGSILTSWDEAMYFTYPSEVYDAISTANRTDDILWYVNGTKDRPGTPPDDVLNLNTYAYLFHEYLDDSFGWDSINNNGMAMVGRANYYHVNMSANNACWSCGPDDAVFNAGMVVLDVVSHEFGHGLVQMSAGGLVYAGHSGALNEAHADIFAEYLNCQGGCNWQMGLDVFGNLASSGVLRDLSDPTLHGHPDSIGTLNIAIDPCGKTNDNCFVHSNNGVANKVAYLIAEGDTHYGVNVYGMGVPKAEQLVFSTLMDLGLTSTATYNEYRDVMMKACDALKATPVALSDWNCRNVYRAWLSVGMSHLTQAMAGAWDESYDNFGYVIASGNFNGDSYDDLAVSVPFETYSGAPSTGVVMVFYGSYLGLRPAYSEIITQQHVGAVSETNDKFGWSLASGDFNGDSYDDLAIGVPYEDFAGVVDTGVVNILYGSTHGLLLGGAAKWERLDQEHSSGLHNQGDKFGYALTAGNFDGDAYDDLAVSRPYEDYSLEPDSGKVDVFYGSSNGLLYLDAADWESFSNADSGGVIEKDDMYGYRLSSGNFNGDAYDDLVIGHPHEDQGGIPNAGQVSILYGSSSGLYPENWLILGEGLGGGLAEPYDVFGYSLTSGDFDNDGYDDLAVGIPYEDFGSTTNTGAVTIFYGSSSGLYPTDWVRLDWSLMYGQPSVTNDKYGWALAAGDFDGDGYDDLAVGIPYDDYSGFTNNGGVHYYYGSSHGLYPPTMDFGGQSYLGGMDESDDYFGYSLAVGDFDNNGLLDVAIGAPKEDLFGGSVDSGAVYVREF
jgi:Zn-dependent metalloprotease